MPDIADYVLSGSHDDPIEVLRSVVERCIRESLFMEVYGTVNIDGQQFIDRGFQMWYDNLSVLGKAWYEARV